MTHFSLFTMILLDTTIYGCTHSQYKIILILLLHIIMNVADYWPMAREYSIWNATVAALQFWTADLEAHVLSSTIEQVYNAFFYTTSMHLLCQQFEEVLFSCFMTTLNAKFESKLALEDKGYESGSENFNIPTPLRHTSKVHHVSSDDNISFDPTTPCSTGASQAHHKPIQCQLSFNNSDDEDSSGDDIPPTCSTTPPQNLLGFAQQTCYKPIYNMCNDLEKDEEEEDFQTVPLEDDHWTTEEIPDICLYMNIQYLIHCVHTHVHIWIILLHHTTTHWISVTFLNLRTWWPHPVMRIFQV